MNIYINIYSYKYIYIYKYMNNSAKHNGNLRRSCCQ